MLNNAAPKERFVEGDAYDVSQPLLRFPITPADACTSAQQIAKKCRHVQPKLQKWIAESAESNPEGMGTSRVSRRSRIVNITLTRIDRAQTDCSSLTT